MIRTFFLSTALGLVASSAQAQTFSVDAVGAISPGMSSQTSGGLFHPALAVDNLGSLIVAFATSVNEPGCSEAWAIGYAASSDGVNWTISSDYVIAPRAGTSAACGAHSPTLVMDENNVARLWFTTVNAQGNERISTARVGYESVKIRKTTGLTGIAEPSVAMMGGEYRMLGVDSTTGDLVSAISSNGVNWTRDASAALPVGAVSFGVNGYSSPALTCESGAAFPWTMHYAGSDQGVLTDWGYGVSSDGAFWFLSPALGFPGGLPTSFDALETDSGGTVIVYAEADGQGGSHLSFASTSTWAPVDLASRICP